MGPSAVTALLWSSLLFLLLASAVTQDVEECESKKGCGSCIQTPGCQWCSQISQENKKGKCYSAFADLTDKCFRTNSSNYVESNYVENPENKLTIIKNENLTEANSEAETSQKLVQLQPQKIKLKLRKDVSQ